MRTCSRTQPYLLPPFHISFPQGVGPAVNLTTTHMVAIIIIDKRDVHPSTGVRFCNRLSDNIDTVDNRAKWVRTQVVISNNNAVDGCRNEGTQLIFIFVDWGPVVVQSIRSDPRSIPRLVTVERRDVDNILPVKRNLGQENIEVVIDPFLGVSVHLDKRLVI